MARLHLPTGRIPRRLGQMALAVALGNVGGVSSPLSGTGPEGAPATSVSTSLGRPEPCDRDVVLLIGHRGTGSGSRVIRDRTFSENTVPAFVEALESGADGIETDYWPTADGRIVAHHDATLDRMTAGTGRIDEHAWAEVARLRQSGGAGIPTFEDVVAVSNAHGGLRQQEVKEGDVFSNRMLAQMVAADVGDGPSSYERVLYTSSELRTLRRIHAVDRRMPLGLITLSATGRPRLKHLPRWLDVVLIDLRAADTAFVRAATARGLAVSVRGVDTASQLHHAVEVGATRVLTNRPDVLGRGCVAVS